MPPLSPSDVVARALAAVEARLEPLQGTGPTSSDEDRAALRVAGRVTVAFHPDRLDRRGLTAAEGLLADGGYLPQWLTGASSGSRSAIPGGLRATWERAQFAVDADVAPAHRPVYGALDLLQHRHGGSPAFGSCYLVLHDRVRDRCTLSVGDSHLGPDEIGTFRQPDAILNGLRAQATGRQLLGQDLGIEDLQAVLVGRRRNAPNRTLDHYIEVQIHGGVHLQDIATIVADPSFQASPVETQLQQAADAAGARLTWHPASVITPRDLASHPGAIAWVSDDTYLARLVDELEQLARPSSRATAAHIGKLVAGTRPGPPSIDGDHPRSKLQRVKHLWRLTYRFGHDAVPDDA